MVPRKALLRTCELKIAESRPKNIRDFTIDGLQKINIFVARLIGKN